MRINRLLAITASIVALTVALGTGAALARPSRASLDDSRAGSGTNAGATTTKRTPIPGLPSAPVNVKLDVTLTSAYVSWDDTTNDASSFTVYKRQHDGTTRAVKTIQGRSANGHYFYRDWDFDPGFDITTQCFTVAARDVYSNAAPEVCAPRVLTGGPYFASTDKWAWHGIGSVNGGGYHLCTFLTAAQSPDAHGCLAHEDRFWGASVGFSDTGTVKVQRENGSPVPLMLGENVAIGVPGGGWLKSAHQTFGVDLDYSDTPVYEWRFYAAKGSFGLPITSGSIALYNDSKGAFLVPHDQAYGVHLEFVK